MEAPFGPPAPVLRPPPDRLGDLVEPLSPAEERVYAALTGLDPGWTVYTKPRIGLDDPDFLAIHDRFGVCAIEVVDWTPETTRCTSGGRLETLSADGSWQPVGEEPRFRASRHRSSIFDQFYALPEHGGSPSSTIRSVVVLPAFTTVGAGDLFAQCGEDGRTSLVGLWGGDGLTADSIGDIVRGLGCPPPAPESIEKLRRHVVASERSQIATGWDARMSAAMIEVAENPAQLSRRRVVGGAGSGKSTALAARAARLAANGRRVLLLSFNVTLANRLRSMVDAHARDVGANPTLVACANLHSFCTRVVQDAEVSGAHLAAPPGMPWTVGIIAKATQAYEHGFGTRYDAVLVDEGQDFTQEWWNLLRDHVLATGGEMLVAADPTQDIYDRVSWLDTDDDAEPGLDVAGRTVHLDESLRMPNDLLALSGAFATSQLEGETIVSNPIVTDDAGSVRIWTDVDRVQELGPAVGHEVVRLLQECPTLTPGDVSFVCDYHHDGVAAVRVIEAAGIPVHHIFSRDPDAPRRRRKHRFWPDVEAVKGCTAHSLKGWQSPAVVLGVGADDRARRLAYVAMTRTALPDDGGPAFVSVVNADRSLREFGVSFSEGSADAPRLPASAAWTPTSPAPPPPPSSAPAATPPLAAPPAAAPPREFAEPLVSPSVPLAAPATLHGVPATVPAPPPPLPAPAPAAPPPAAPPGPPPSI